MSTFSVVLLAMSSTCHVQYSYLKATGVHTLHAAVREHVQSKAVLLRCYRSPMQKSYLSPSSTSGAAKDSVPKTWSRPGRHSPPAIFANPTSAIFALPAYSRQCQQSLLYACMEAVATHFEHYSVAMNTHKTK